MNPPYAINSSPTFGLPVTLLLVNPERFRESHLRIKIFKIRAVKYREEFRKNVRFYVSP
jgi:hypothetical protein